MAQYFYDKQIRRYIQQFIRLFSGFNVQMGVDATQLPVYQQVPVRYGDINRMAAHITRENSENVVNSVPFISCYVVSLDMMPERRTYQNHVDRVQVYEKKFDSTTGDYTDEVGNRYTVERHAPVPYQLTMNCDIWTSNTDQKLQLLEQIMVLFNPTLDIRTTHSPLDWSALSQVEMTNTVWSSRSVGSSIDDIIDVATLTFQIPIYINPPAKLKQQKLIHTIVNQLYNLADDDMDLFKENLPFNNTTVEYTIVTYENRKLRFENNLAQLLSLSGSNLDEEGNLLEWEQELKAFGPLRPGISQIRLRKNSDPGVVDDDIIGKLYPDLTDPNRLVVEIDDSTLPTNTLTAIDGIVDPTKNYPGDGVLLAPSLGQRYLVINNVPATSLWGVVASKNDIVEYNGTAWIVSFDSQSAVQVHYVMNTASDDQLEWSDGAWRNSFEGVYNAGYWRLYL
jgi:hypothetical protein